MNRKREEIFPQIMPPPRFPVHQKTAASIIPKTVHSSAAEYMTASLINQ
jgi:hypothetical protein